MASSALTPMTVGCSKASAARLNHTHHVRRLALRARGGAARLPGRNADLGVVGALEQKQASSEFEPEPLNSAVEPLVTPSAALAGEVEKEEPQQPVPPKWLSDEVWNEGGEEEFWGFKWMRETGEMLSVANEEGMGETKFGKVLDKVVIIFMVGFLPVYAFSLWTIFQEAPGPTG